jgi:hypothetical protein
MIANSFEWPANNYLRLFEPVEEFWRREGPFEPQRDETREHFHLVLSGGQNGLTSQRNEGSHISLWILNQRSTFTAALGGTGPAMPSALCLKPSEFLALAGASLLQNFMCI